MANLIKIHKVIMSTKMTPSPKAKLSFQKKSLVAKVSDQHPHFKTTATFTF